MADNYLERRMEDLKAGRLTPQVPARSAGPRKGRVEFPFPPRRVLVVGGTHGVALGAVRAFLKTGSKVAVFDQDKAAGDSLAYNEGIRYYNIDPSSPDSVTASFKNLLEAWRDIDILIIADFHHFANPLVDIWTTHRDRYPVPFGYAGRLILIYPDLPADSPRVSPTQEPSASSPRVSPTYESYASSPRVSPTHEQNISHLSSQLHPYRITANAILKSASPTPELRDPVRLIMTLTLPGSDFISSLLIYCQ